MTRSTRRHEVTIDVRCRNHDRRMGLLWADVRHPDVLHTRLPGGTALPDGWTTARLECPVCGLWVTVARDWAERILRYRTRERLMAPFVWSLWPADRGGNLGASSRAVSGAAAGTSSTGPSFRRD